MKYSFISILLILSINLNAQDSSHTLLPSDIIKAVKPSSQALQEIKEMKSFDSTFKKTITEYSGKNGSSEGFTFNYAPYYNYLRKIILSNDELFLRQYAAIQLSKYFWGTGSLIKKDTVLEYTCLQILKPGDIVWRIDPLNSIIYFANIYINLAIRDYLLKLKISYTNLNAMQKKDYTNFMEAKGIEYRRNIYDKNPDRLVKANALRNILDELYLFNDYEKADYYYHILKNNFSDINDHIIKTALVEYDPGGRLRVGRIMPDFNFKLIGSYKTITNEKLKGSYYLLQFWATWCGPCVAEMPEIHKVYEKYKNKNLKIVSVSLDDSLGKVKNYWSKYGSMPWYNAILNKGFKDNEIKYLGITGIPDIVLVSPDGKILANSDSFRQKSLAETVYSFLNHK